MKIFNDFIHNCQKQLPQYLVFRCRMTHLDYFLKNLGTTFELQQELLKTEMNHDELYAENWSNK